MRKYFKKKVFLSFLIVISYLHQTMRRLALFVFFLTKRILFDIFRARKWPRVCWHAMKNLDFVTQHIF